MADSHDSIDPRQVLTRLNDQPDEKPPSIQPGLHHLRVRGGLDVLQGDGVLDFVDFLVDFLSTPSATHKVIPTSGQGAPYASAHLQGALTEHEQSPSRLLNPLLPLIWDP